MDYYDYMDVLEDSPVMDQVLSHVESYDPDTYTAADVVAALNSDYLTPNQFAALLSPAAVPFLPQMTERAKYDRERYFGNSVYLFSPLYIANFCENQCVYCGFNCTQKISRRKLNDAEIEEECRAMAATGLEEVLMLTGESPTYSDIDYIANACTIAARYFKNVGIEIYPTNVEDYKKLHEAGADFVTVFQETYDRSVYGDYHLRGNKRIFPYRFDAQERALMGGMRGVAFSALLGLSEPRHDALATGLHAWYLQKRYPHAEISLSCPRLRPVAGRESDERFHVTEKMLYQILLAYRIFMPFAGITVSTRERDEFRNRVMRICATKISAGSKTGIGEHSDNIETEGDDQFDVADVRDLADVIEDLKAENMQPVLNDYVYVG